VLFVEGFGVLYQDFQCGLYRAPASFWRSDAKQIRNTVPISGITKAEQVRHIDRKSSSQVRKKLERASLLAAL
jgi:hypothetical protein